MTAQPAHSGAGTAWPAYGQPGGCLLGALEADDSAGSRRPSWRWSGEPGQGQGGNVNLNILLHLEATGAAVMGYAADGVSPPPAIQPGPVKPPTPISSRMIPRQLHQAPECQP